MARAALQTAPPTLGSLSRPHTSGQSSTPGNARFSTWQAGRQRGWHMSKRCHWRRAARRMRAWLRAPAGTTGRTRTGAGSGGLPAGCRGAGQGLSSCMEAVTAAQQVVQQQAAQEAARAGGGARRRRDLHRRLCSDGAAIRCLSTGAASALPVGRAGWAPGKLAGPPLLRSLYLLQSQVEPSAAREQAGNAQAPWQRHWAEAVWKAGGKAQGLRA